MLMQMNSNVRDGLLSWEINLIYININLSKNRIEVYWRHRDRFISEPEVPIAMSRLSTGSFFSTFHFWSTAIMVIK